MNDEEKVDNIEPELMFRSLFDFAPDAVIIVDSNGQIIRANAQAEKIFGYAKKELLGSPVDILIPLRFRKSHNEHMKSYIKNPRVRLMGEELELYGLRKDKTEFPVDIALGYLKTEEGMIVLSIVRDITEHKMKDTRINLLLTLTQAINESKDLNEAMEISLKKICEATGWNYGEAWVLGKDRKSQVCSPVWYSKDNSMEKFRRRSEQCVFQSGTGLPGRVWSSKKPEWLPDVSKISEQIYPRVTDAKECGIRAGLGVPIISNDEVLAVLVFLMSKQQKKDKALVDIVSAVATQLGTVIERKLAQDTIRVSEAKYRNIFENAAEGIFQTSIDGRILTANPACIRILGYSSAEELIGGVADVRKLYAEPGRRLHLVRLIRSEGSVSEFEALVYRKDKSKIWVSINAHALEDQGGKVIGIEGIVIDITNRKRAEKNFQTLIDGAPDAIIAIDNNFNILLINKHTEKLFGYTRLELLGSSYEMLIPEEFRTKHVAYCKNYFADPSTKIMALHSGAVAKHKDGNEYPVEINMSPVETDEGIVIVIDIRDITEKKKMI